MPDTFLSQVVSSNFPANARQEGGFQCTSQTNDWRLVSPTRGFCRTSMATPKALTYGGSHTGYLSRFAQSMRTVRRRKAIGWKRLIACRNGMAPIAGWDA